MGNYLSAGVYSLENDISNIIPNLATTSAAIVGWSGKGSADVRLITNTRQFIEEYGEPVPTSGSYFHYTAMAFLERGSTLYCKRAMSANAMFSGMLIGVTGTDELPIDGGLTSDNVSAMFADSIAPVDLESTKDIEDYAFLIIGKDQGAWNNRIGIKIVNVIGADDEATDANTFEIQVYYTANKNLTVFNTSDNVLVETWKVSRQHKLDGFGQQLFLEDKINNNSKYIKVYNNSLVADTIDLAAVSDSGNPVAMIDGSAGSTPTSSPSDYITVATTAWDAFANPDEYDIRLLIEDGTELDYTVSGVGVSVGKPVPNKLKTIAEARKDCMGLLCVPNVVTASECLAYNTLLNINSSYMAIYAAPWVKVWDSFNNQLMEVPATGGVGAQYAYNDYVANPWNAPAGSNRGQLNVLGTTKIWTKEERDTLYAAGINPIQQFRGEGVQIYGQKTMQKKASALNRVNVRRLLITIEKAITVALKDFLFESNDSRTRFRISAMITEYLDRLRSMGAFQSELGDNGYKVVCDSNNNTPAVIDSNQLNVDVFVKPVRVAEFVQLRTTITSTGVSFNELISNGVVF